MIAATFQNPHAAAMQHPGMQHGQPIAPGQVPHPQTMAGQPMQMHPGSAAGVSHVTQAGAIMAGMHQGMVPVGPNSHAMSHLSSGGQMMHPQNMQQYQMNPALMQQQQQMRSQAIRNHILQQQQQQQGNITMALQANPGITQQQLVAMQQAAGVGHLAANIPAHLQQQMAQIAGPSQQQLAYMRSQQQQQQQQMLQAQAHQIHQQQQHQAQQAHLAMQQVHSQSGNHQAPPGMSGPQQPPTSGPMRPPTAMGIQREAQSSPAPPAKPLHQPQPQTPLQQPASVTTQVSQMPQNQPTAGPPTQQKPVPMPQPQVQGQVQMQPQAQQQQQAPQQRQLTQAQMMQQMSMRQMMITRSMRVSRFAEQIGQYRVTSQTPNDFNHWRQFIDQYFNDSGRIVLSLCDEKNGSVKQYQVINSLIPRFFMSLYEGQIEQLQLTSEGTTEKAQSETQCQVTSERSRLMYWFDNGVPVIWNGRLEVRFTGDKIDQLLFEVDRCDQYIPRGRLEELCALASPAPTKSPRIPKNATNKKGNQGKAAAPSFERRHLPEPLVNELGITSSTQMWLELGELFGWMQELISYSKENPALPFSEVMDSLVQSMKTQNLAQGAMQMQGAHAAMMQQMQQAAAGRLANGPMNMSPAMQHGLLPNVAANGSPHLSSMPNPMAMNAANMAGNPHTPSPGQSNMAPPMVAQQSHTGSVPGASANSSPGVSGKRRRSTAPVKNEDDGDMNGTTLKKIKPSPQLSNSKRGKQG